MKEIKAYVHKSRVADVIAALKDTPVWGGIRGAGRHHLAVCVRVLPPPMLLLAHNKPPMLLVALLTLLLLLL